VVHTVYVHENKEQNPDPAFNIFKNTKITLKVVEPPNMEKIPNINNFTVYFVIFQVVQLNFICFISSKNRLTVLL